MRHFFTFFLYSHNLKLYFFHNIMLGNDKGNFEFYFSYADTIHMSIAAFLLAHFHSSKFCTAWTTCDKPLSRLYAGLVEEVGFVQDRFIL